MKDMYMERVLKRSRELQLLELAADRMPETASFRKWLIALSFSIAGVLFPAVSAAQAFAYLM